MIEWIEWKSALLKLKPFALFRKALSKIEKSKQTIEQDACQLEREMRVLGLSPRNRKPLSTSTTLLTSVMSSTAATVTPKVVIKNISAVEPPPPLVTQAYQQRRLSLEVLFDFALRPSFIFVFISSLVSGHWIFSQGYKLEYLNLT